MSHCSSCNTWNSSRTDAMKNKDLYFRAVFFLKKIIKRAAASSSSILPAEESQGGHFAIQTHIAPARTETFPGQQGNLQLRILFIPTKTCNGSTSTTSNHTPLLLFSSLSHGDTETIPAFLPFFSPPLLNFAKFFCQK